MNEAPPKKQKKPRVKRSALESGIYPNFDKDGKPDGTYDVFISRRMWMSESKPHGQMFRRKRRVNGEVAARRVKRKFLDEMAMEAMKYSENDTTWGRAREQYYKNLDKRHKEGSVAFTTMATTIATLDKHTKKWDSKWISEFSADFIEAFLHDPNLKLDAKSADTRLNILKYIRAVFKRQIAIGRLTHNPAAGIYVKVGKKKSFPESMKHNEVIKVIEFVKEKNIPWESVYILAYLTGARSGELWSLKWYDIQFETKSIKITTSYDWKSKKEKPTKGKKDRSVPMNSELITYLKELKLKSNSDYVLPRINDWQQGRAAEVLNGFQAALKIRKSKFHAIRGALITDLLLKGTPLILVQLVAGHDDIETTLGYLRALGDETKGATDSLTLKFETDDDSKVVDLNGFKDKKVLP